MGTWCEVRNFASQKFRLTPDPSRKEKSTVLPESTSALQFNGQLFLKVQDRDGKAVPQAFLKKSPDTQNIH